MSTLLATIIVLFLNLSGTPAMQEDDPRVLTLAGVAQGVLLETHPRCGRGEVGWDFGGDGSVFGIAEKCEWSAGFWLDEHGLWHFTVEHA